MSRLRNYMRDRKQRGFIVSAELIFIVTILVIGLIVGWVAIRNAVVAELHDVSEAIGAVNQSFQFTGTNGEPGVPAALTAGSNFDDAPDAAAAGPGSIIAGDTLPVTVIAPAGATEVAP